MHKETRLIDNGIKFFNQIKYGLKIFFNIEATNVFLDNQRSYRRDGIITRGVRMKIKRRDSLYRFYKLIGFEDKIKQQKLKKILFDIKNGPEEI